MKKFIPFLLLALVAGCTNPEVPQPVEPSKEEKLPMPEPEAPEILPIVDSLGGGRPK